MARRAVRQRFIRPAPRTKMWVGHGLGSTAVTASSVALLGSLNAAALLLRPFTILRTHLVLHYRSDQQAASELPFGTFGDIVVTDQAVAAGVASIPDPDSIGGDPDAGWFIIKPVVNFFQFLTGVGFDAQSGPQFELDSKAMRKVGPNDDVASVFAQSAAVGGNIFINGRMLV